jgi:hypothetical protein
LSSMFTMPKFDKEDTDEDDEMLGGKQNWTLDEPCQWKLKFWKHLVPV